MGPLRARVHYFSVILLTLLRLLPLPRQDLEFGIDCDSRIALVGPNGAGELGGGRCSLQLWCQRRLGALSNCVWGPIDGSHNALCAVGP